MKTKETKETKKTRETKICKCIRHKSSGHSFYFFPIIEIWGITILTSDDKVLYITSEDGRVTYQDITGDYEVITYKK